VDYFLKTFSRPPFLIDFFREFWNKASVENWKNFSLKIKMDANNGRSQKPIEFELGRIDIIFIKTLCSSPLQFYTSKPHDGFCEKERLNLRREAYSSSAINLLKRPSRGKSKGWFIEKKIISIKEECSFFSFCMELYWYKKPHGQ